MQDQCVACGEISEGKPLYKKLGGHPDVEVFAALITMNVIDMPPSQKKNCYLCWDCDEIIGEEYANYCAHEKKQKDDEKKRREQDIIRNQKLNKKLTKALQRVREEELCTAQGIDPPISSYKQKAQNRYHSSHCLLCNCTFESRNGFQRYHLQKMIDDDTNVHDALKVLGTGPNVQEKDKSKRFICSTCYNKVRRNFKTAVGGVAVESLNSSILSQTNGTPVLDTLKYKTVDEHAAEMAKILPPALADVYKIMGKDPPDPIDSRKKHLSKSSHSPIGSSSHRSKKHYPKKNVMIPGRVRTHLPKNSTPGTSSSQETQEVICNICGLCYTGRPQSFWLKLYGPVSTNGMTIHKALKELDTDLAEVSQEVRQQGLVCRLCYSRISSALENKLKQEGFECKDEDKENGICTNNANLKTIIRRPGSSNKSVYKDIELLKMINESKHLRFRGKVIELRSFSINLLDVGEILLEQTHCIPCEHLQDLFIYTNFGRLLFGNKPSQCYLCRAPIKATYCHWLDDAVSPPNLMVPIKWAYLSAISSDKDLSNVSGKVCDECHKTTEKNFIKFASEKILVNETSLTLTEALKTYKISFDSKSLNVVAEILKSSNTAEKLKQEPESLSTNEKLQKKENFLNGHQLNVSQKTSNCPRESSTHKYSPMAHAVKTPPEEESPFNLTDDLALSDTDDEDDLSSTPTPMIVSTSSPKPSPQTRKTAPNIVRKTLNGACPLSVRLKRNVVSKSTEPVATRKNGKRSIDDNSTAPFTQRKRPRSNIVVPKKKPLEGLWQSMQQLNMDDLVNEDSPQPVRPDQLTFGLLSALDDYRMHLGATTEHLLDWLEKILPLNCLLNCHTLCRPLVRKFLETAQKEDLVFGDRLPDSWIIKDPPSQSNTSIESCVADTEMTSPFSIDDLIEGKQKAVPKTQFDVADISAISDACTALKIDSVGQWTEQLFPYYKNPADSNGPHKTSVSDVDSNPGSKETLPESKTSSHNNSSKAKSRSDKNDSAKFNPLLNSLKSL